MIYPFVGDWLNSPIPLQLSFNYCSHKCSYCFANLNAPGRTFDAKAFQTQLKGAEKNSDLVSTLLREKYPVLISNLVDPFATSNYKYAVPAIEMLTAMGVPVSIQTRGGKGIDDVLEFLPPSLWYISIPMLNDEVRKQVEPAAPSIPSRLELITKLKNKGHNVVVGINPTVESWWSGNDVDVLLDTLVQSGVTGIWLAGLHLNQRQIKVMPERDKELLGDATITQAMKDARKLSQETFNFVDGVKQKAWAKGLYVKGLFEGEENYFFDAYTSVYPKTFPTLHTLTNWVWKNKPNDSPVYYHEFKTLLEPFLPKGDFNVSPYMRCMSAKLDDEVRADEGYKQSFEWLLNLSWNDYRMKRQLHDYWHFTVGMRWHKNKPDWFRDVNGNLIYFFNQEIYEDNFFIINSK